MQYTHEQIIIRQFVENYKYTFYVYTKYVHTKIVQISVKKAINMQKTLNT